MIPQMVITTSRCPAVRDVACCDWAEERRLLPGQQYHKNKNRVAKLVCSRISDRVSLWRS